MEEWSKNLFEALESVACAVDEFFLGVTEMAEEIADNVENTVGAEIEQFFQDSFESIIEIYYEFEDISSETDELFTYPVEADPEKHPACIGCCHYHGQVYGGNLLVCAMHPYGWDTENCPDWESNID